MSLTGVGALMLFMSVDSTVRSPPVPLGLTIVFGLIGLAALIAPYLLARPYYVAISAAHVAAGRRRSAPTGIVERSRIAHVIRSDADRRVTQFELRAADDTTLLRMDRWICANQAAEIARTLDVPFWRTSAKYGSGRS